MNIEERLRKNTLLFLTASGRTQGELALHVGLKRNTLNGKLRRGDSTLLPHLQRLADFFGVDPRIMLADPDRVWRDYAVTDEYLGALEPVA